MSKKFFQVINKAGYGDDRKYESLEDAVETATERAQTNEDDFYVTVTEAIRVVKTPKVPVEVTTL